MEEMQEVEMITFTGATLGPCDNFFIGQLCASQPYALAQGDSFIH
jgi:hypothetical protein